MSTKWSPPTTVLVRPASKLSLLVGLAEPFSSSAPCESTPRSPTPRSFAYDSAVGLRIVAAMNDVPARAAAGECGLAAVARTPRTAVAPRSAPIPVVSARRTGPPRKQYGSEKEDGEMSESYTCVVSHVGGGDAVRRRVYLDVDGAGDYCVGCFGVFSGFPPAARLPMPAPAAAFLSRCFRCRKRLHGLDIFMYRGDKAFCSEECRCQQMLSDERREKGVSDAVKPHDCSLPLFNSLALRGRVCSCLDMQYPGEESAW